MKAVLVLISICSSVAFAEGMIRVRPRYVAQPGSQVKLSALVDGQDLSPELQSQLASVNLSVAPNEGEKQEIASANITSILRPLIQAERERTGKPLHVVIPKSVEIDTTHGTMSVELLSGEMLQAWQPLCADCQLEIESLSLPRVEKLRDWSLRLKPELPRGSFSVPIDLVRENGQMTPAWVSGRLVIKKKVPVLTRAASVGDRVAAKDFTWEYRDTSFAIDGIPASDEIVGRRMRQGLHAGDILWKGMLERERAVRAGEAIQLKSTEGDWEVTLNVVAQQDAYIGDVIHFKNPKTNNVLMGQVTGQGEAELR